MSINQDHILKKINGVLEVASALTAVQNQVEQDGLLFFQIEKSVRNLRKSVMIWSSHFLDRLKYWRNEPVTKLTEKEKSILCTGIATPINQALALLEKISTLPNVRSLNREILLLEQTQESLAIYLNHFTDFIRSSKDDEEWAAWDSQVEQKSYC